MKYRILGVSCILLMLIISCATIQYPDVYDKCTHVESGEVIKFVEGNSTIHSPEECADYLQDQDGRCPTVVIIEDVYGETHHLSGIQVNNYRCITINSANEQG